MTSRRAYFRDKALEGAFSFACAGWFILRIADVLPPALEPFYIPTQLLLFLGYVAATWRQTEGLAASLTVESHSTLCILTTLASIAGGIVVLTTASLGELSPRGFLAGFYFALLPMFLGRMVDGLVGIRQPLPALET
jgi:hypothetical protein